LTAEYEEKINNQTNKNLLTIPLTSADRIDHSNIYDTKEIRTEKMAV